MSQGLNDIGN